MNKALVIAADNSYLVPLETLLKSICRHNTGFHIYIFNQDIAPEWFYHIGKKVSLSGNYLTDTKLSLDSFGTDWQLLEHINSLVTYARYYIPQYVKEERVLYLDSDTLVTGELSPLLNRDLQAHPIAAVSEAIVLTRFNAGVLLIDNGYWKTHDITQRLVALTNDLQGQLVNGDQEVLNHYFETQWLNLEITYNYQIGFDLLIHLRQEHNPVISQPIKTLPLIIHYLSSDKPWNTYSSHRLREVWWYYHGLDWSEIILADKRLPLPQENSYFRRPTDFLIVTNSQDIEYLPELLEALPDLSFHVAAYTEMGNQLLHLASHSNLILHPAVTDFVLDDLIADCRLYLDINFGPKLTQVLNRIEERQIPLFSFEKSQSQGRRAQVFASDKAGLQEMIRTIKEQLSHA